MIRRKREREREREKERKRERAFLLSFLPLPPCCSVSEDEDLLFKYYSVSISNKELHVESLVRDREHGSVCCLLYFSLFFLSLFVSLCVSLSVCVCVSVCMSVCLSLSLFISLSHSLCSLVGTKPSKM